MKKYFTFILIQIFNVIFFIDARAQKCVSLEGKNLGCTSSYSHECKGRIENVRDSFPDATRQVDCEFFTGVDEVLGNFDGPIAKDCKSWKPESPCAKSAERTNCPDSECATFDEPVCNEVCRPCYNDKKITRETVPYKGCFIGACNRDRCGDEPDAGEKSIEGFTCIGNPELPACKYRFSVACPRDMPSDSSYKRYDPAPRVVCAQVQRCPGAITLSDGRVLSVRVQSASCSNKPSPVVSSSGDVADCPWQTSFGKKRQNCEAIPECCKYPKISGYETKCPKGCE